MLSPNQRQRRLFSTEETEPLPPCLLLLPAPNKSLDRPYPLGHQVTPLLHAVVTGNQKVVERLLLYKADVLHVVSTPSSTTTHKWTNQNRH